MDGSSDSATPLRVWLLPFCLLLLGSAAVFATTLLLDGLSSGTGFRGLQLFLDPNPQSAVETLSNAGEIAAAVLAIAITVVAIVVELAANRYTHRITELFVAEPVNFLVSGFFVLTALQSLWVTLIFDWDPATQTGFVPWIGVHVAMVMLALCLLILLPYFGFVFTFLSPTQIVQRIRRHTIAAIRPASRLRMNGRQQEAVRGIEQIADVGLNAMENKDKGVSMASVNALFDLVSDYRGLRPSLAEAWFRVQGDLAQNPDFVSMAPAVLETVTGRRIWFEMKVLRQYQTLYNEALNRMRDINYLIAINTRRLAEYAIEDKNHDLLELTLKFFNTFLRSTINAKDVRTAYNVLNQYRLLAEDLLFFEDGARAVEVARYFKYYGLTGYGGGLPFVLETVAYDLCALNELAFDRQSPAADELLEIFLEVDKESETEEQEASLRGVRKAQVKLATHYLLAGNRELARRVFQDMAGEQPTRLASIRDELNRIRSSEFWEISDRGVNFDYLTPEGKTKMLEFFGWFGPLASPAPVDDPLVEDSLDSAPAPALFATRDPSRSFEAE